MLHKIHNRNLFWKGKYFRIILILLITSFLFIIFKHLIFNQDALKRSINFETIVGCLDSDVTTNTVYNGVSDTTSTAEYKFITACSSEGGNNVKTTPSNSTLDITDESVLANSTLEYLRNMLNCGKKNYVSRKMKRGEYWIFENYVKADHGDLECYQYVTLATHAGYAFLDNLEILVQRWLGPVSLALYSPGSDLLAAVDSIDYLRYCSPQKTLIKKWVTFHLYFLSSHLPQNISKMNGEYNCSLPPPFAINYNQTYKFINNLTYPINMGRNLARDFALTHYVLSVDIELYPSPSLGTRFLNMLARNSSLVQDKKRRVFVIKPFEIEKNREIPLNKTALLKMYRNGTAVPFHHHVCQLCHNTPLSNEWVAQGETLHMEITGKCNRTGTYSQWESVFICTKDDPQFEDKLSWEGMRDKMSQSYLICVQDYEILILSNAFLVHRPGIHYNYPLSDKRWQSMAHQSEYIDTKLHKEYDLIFGTREGCVL